MSQVTEDLIQRAVDGDRAAFEALWIASERYVRSIAAGNLGWGQDHHVDEVVARTAIRVFERLQELESPRAYWSWLRRITARLTVDYLRELARLYEPSPDGGTREGGDPGEGSFPGGGCWRPGSPYEALWRRQLSELVTGALRRLPPRERELVILVYLQGHSLAEAARRLGISVGTVKRALYDAKRRMRSMIQPFTRP